MACGEGGPAGGEGALQHTVTYNNSWVVAVDGARRRLPGWAALLIASGVLALGLLGGAALYRLSPGFGASYAGEVVDRLWLYACVLGPLAVAALALARGYEKRPAVGAQGSPALHAAAGAGLGAGLFLLALALVAVLGGTRPGAGAPMETWRRFSGVGVGAALILVQAGAEEMFFRGWLQPVLAARWGPWVGLAATSLLFAVAHALNRPLAALGFLNDALAGLAFGLLALRTGGLAAPVAAHWGWNWAEQSLAGASPNPGVDPLGALFDVDLVGPGWLSGGADEMNGSVCATLALLALVACVLAWRPKRGHAPN